MRVSEGLPLLLAVTFLPPSAGQSSADGGSREERREGGGMWLVLGAAYGGLGRGDEFSLLVILGQFVSHLYQRVSVGLYQRCVSDS